MANCQFLLGIALLFVSLHRAARLGSPRATVVRLRSSIFAQHRSFLKHQTASDEQKSSGLAKNALEKMPRIRKANAPVSVSINSGKFEGSERNRSDTNTGSAGNASEETKQLKH